MLPGRKPPPGPDKEPTPPERDERREVVDYRVERFMLLGFDSVDAIDLAESGADLHMVARILAGGATHTMALRISL